MPDRVVPVRYNVLMNVVAESPLVTGAAPPSLLQASAARCTAVVDVATRTALASVVAAAALPALATARSSGVEHLDFYQDLAKLGDASVTFRAPPNVEIRDRRLSPPAWLRGVGMVDSLTFKSPYQARNPDVAASVRAHRRNRIARAQLWRHHSGPRPTIIVLHGFAAEPVAFNSAFFSLPWFYGNGCDVLLVTLPYHGSRAHAWAGLNGIELLTRGLVRLNEALLQAVSDVRVLVDWLLAEGVPQVGITGLSLGGYLTASLAAAEPRLAFAIPNAPATDLATLIRAWFPAGPLLQAALRYWGKSFDDLRATVAVHSPLTYRPAIDSERLFIIGGLGDRFTPPEQALQLWEHWDRCRLHWYPGNHVVHLQRGEYLREVGRFLRNIGFSEGRKTT